jgi:hypothetical protein
MPRYFKLEDAQKRLPEVERALRDALFHKSEYQKADKQIKNTAERIRFSGGSSVNPGSLLAVRAGRDRSIVALKEALEKVEEIGAVVKDLDIGLIDFLTLYHGREVCLCWRLGEDRIRYWHGTDEGFQGRKLIGEEFLESHRGGESNDRTD